MAQQPAYLNAETLETLRGRLLQERARLQHLAAEADGAHDAVGAVEPMNDEPSDFADQGLDLMIEDTVYALSENDKELLAQVERALQRMDDGTYGLSEVTGEPIPLERLEVLPWATTNVRDSEHA